MTTDIVKSSDDAVLGKNQEDRVRPNVVFIVSAHLLESRVMCKTMPCLRHQPEVKMGFAWENIARVSSAKKFSLVYHELGNEARSERG